MLRRSLLALSRNERLKRAVATSPMSDAVVAQYVPGASTADAVRVPTELVSRGQSVSLDHLAADTRDRARADAAVLAQLDLLATLGAAGLTEQAEVSVRLSAIGQALPADGQRIALDNAHRICLAAADVGTVVTLYMEDHTTTDSTLEILEAVRRDFPDTGAVLQSCLRRTEGDCKDLAYAGSRVRLCKYQLLYGVRADEQRRLTDDGHTVRVYLPYGTEWYDYVMRRLADRPGPFLRSLLDTR